MFWYTYLIPSCPLKGIIIVKLLWSAKGLSDFKGALSQQKLWDLYIQLDLDPNSLLFSSELSSSQTHDL